LADEFEERHRGDLDLLIGHFVELGDGELGGILDAVEIGIVGRLVPLEELVSLMKFFTRKYFAPCMKLAVSAIRPARRSRAENVEHGKGDLARFGGIEKADVAQRGQRGDISPARMSITVTDGLDEFRVSKIFKSGPRSSSCRRSR